MKKISYTYLMTILILLGCSSGDSAEKVENKQENMTEHKYTNRLIDENSPYLLSHAHNPVDWYPWGEEALSEAKKQNKPIFLSIGYAACHWCHVMERESFENEAIASLMNKYFINIKVDREQRPDLDQIYMNFTQAMTGQGGWPMSVFLTPDLKPFFAGTYFPPDDRYGRPGFIKVINEIGQTFLEDEESIIKSADDLFSSIAPRLTQSFPETLLNKEMLKISAETLMRNFDQTNGGFGSAPKFPHAMELSLFLRYYKKSGDLSYLQSAELALNGMADGGIYDHLGGGFARYSVDEKWLVPHFEKMLYDNGLLVTVYAEAYQITKNERYLTVITETLDFILREMTDKNGGFYSALDADSEGEEGKFYVWSKKEITEHLGTNADLFLEYYNITEHGNFEGHNILNLTGRSHELKNNHDPKVFNISINSSKKKLMQSRDQRIRPLTDDKILTSWNGLALSAVCKGYQLTGDNEHLEAAVKNARFVKEELFKNEKLIHAYREGKHTDGEFLEDYGYYIRGLLDLYETDPSDSHNQWLEFAETLAQRGVELFMNESGRFFLRPDGQDDLIMRPTDEYDGALPSPGSLFIASLLKLHRLTDKIEYYNKAELGLKHLSGLISANPGGMTSAVLASDYFLNDKIEIVIIGDENKRHDMLKYLYSSYSPDRVIAYESKAGDLPLFDNRSTSDEKATAYVCVNSVCNLPVTTLEELKEQLSLIK